MYKLKGFIKLDAGELFVKDLHGKDHSLAT